MKNSIVYITDNNYCLPTIVSINSFLKSNNAHNYKIYVIFSELIKRNINKIKLFLEKKKVDHEIIEIDPERWTENVPGHSHVSKTALHKYNLPNILNNEKKVLYLDSDIIINHPLDKLFDTDLDNNYASAVKDMCAMIDGDHHKRLSLDFYFNSGVMLLNLLKCRECSVSQKMIDAKCSERSDYFMDQDEFNLVLNEKMVYLSPDYNLMKPNLHYPIELIADFYSLSKKQAEKILDNPTVFHHTNRPKVWNSPGSRYFDHWFAHLRAGDYRDHIAIYSNFENRQKDAIIREKDQAIKKKERVIKEKVKRIEEFRMSWSYRIGYFVVHPWRIPGAVFEKFNLKKP